MNDDTPRNPPNAGDPNPPPSGGSDNWQPLPGGGASSSDPGGDPSRPQPEWVTPEVHEGVPGQPAAGNSQTGLIVAIVLGALETICCCPVGSLFGIAAIIVAAIGLSKNSNRSYAEARKFRNIAFALLAIGLALSIVMLIVWAATGSGGYFQGYEDLINELEAATTSTLPDGFPEP